MNSIRPNLVIGFHGCDAETGHSLLTNPNKLIYSEKPYDWVMDYTFGKIITNAHYFGLRIKKAEVKYKRHRLSEQSYT